MLIFNPNAIGELHGLTVNILRLCAGRRNSEGPEPVSSHENQSHPFLCWNIAYFGWSKCSNAIRPSFSLNKDGIPAASPGIALRRLVSFGPRSDGTQVRRLPHLFREFVQASVWVHPVSNHYEGYNANPKDDHRVPHGGPYKITPLFEDKTPYAKNQAPDQKRCDGCEMEY